MVSKRPFRDLALSVMSAAVIFSTVAMPGTSRAQDEVLTGQVLRYRSGGQSVPFPAAPNENDPAQNPLVDIDRSMNDPEVAQQIQNEPKLPPIYPTLAPRETCVESGTRRVALSAMTQNAPLTDLMFYNPEDPEQNAKAKMYGERAIPYELNSPEKLGYVDPRYMIGNALGLKCLPTRLRVVLDGTQRFVELREGTDTWR